MTELPAANVVRYGVALWVATVPDHPDVVRFSLCAGSGSSVHAAPCTADSYGASSSAAIPQNAARHLLAVDSCSSARIRLGRLLSPIFVLSLARLARSL